jgi:hypothetical protein
MSTEIVEMVGNWGIAEIGDEIRNWGQSRMPLHKWSPTGLLWSNRILDGIYMLLEQIRLRRRD